MNLSPEWKLILACAKTSGEDFAGLRDGLVDTDLDWDYIAKTSCAHGIAPLIYHRLRQSGVISLLPPAAAETLRSSYYGNAARNSLLYEELNKVLKAFREESIDVIALKGAALAETVYLQRALRPMSDIDLLVRKEKLAEVESRLLDIGYGFDEREGTKEWFLEHHYHLVFARQSGITIEIHWHIQRPTDPSRIAIDGFWERAQPVKIAATEALALSPEDLLLHLCQHAHEHKWRGGVRPLCDIAGAIKFYGNKIDWRKLCTLAYEWQIVPCAYLGLSLAWELLDASVSASFLAELKPVNFNMEILSWVRERLLTDRESSPISPDLLRLFWKGRSAKERWAVLQKILSRRVGANGSASKKAYLHYPLRMKHLLTQYGPTVGRLWAGDETIRAAAETEEKQQRLTKWLSSNNQ